MSHLRYGRVLQQLYPEGGEASEPPAAQALAQPNFWMGHGEEMPAALVGCVFTSS